MKVKIYTEVPFGGISFVFYEEVNGRRYVVKPVKFESEIVDDYGIVEPTFRLPNDVSQDFLQEMANEIFKRGIKPEQQPILENELTAVKYHLEDMRKLVFK